MERKDRLGRVTIICKEFSRQWLCFSEIMEYENEIDGMLMITIHNNFFDMALLNWAHLFGNKKDHLHFRNVLNNPDQFKIDQMESLSLSETEWEDNWTKLKEFRDQRVAHIDKIESALVPEMDIAIRCISAYYDEVYTELAQINPIAPFYKTLNDFVEKNAESYSRSINKLVQALKI